MLRYNKRLADIQCVGTDGEVNVSDALKSVFTKANHLLCDIHFRDNVEKKMTELGIAGREKKEMLLDIFGVNKGGVQTKGLVDCWGCRNRGKELILPWHQNSLCLQSIEHCSTTLL